MKNKVYIKTFGCQMNVRDSEVICGLLKNEGYQIIEEPDKADVVLFNTCSVRQHAEDKVWSELGRIAKLSTECRVRSTEKSKLSTQYPVPSTQRRIIGVIGCMAQLHKDTVFQRSPNVDFVIGPSDIHKIPGIIKRLTVANAQAKGSNLYELKIFETDGSIRPEEVYHTGFYEDKEHAYVVISEGCSNFCSYCVVPYVRGQLHNRHHKDILREIEEAVDQGITKITLLGQNVNAYSSQVNFAELLILVNNIKGLKGLSFVTSHPKDTSLDLFKVMADLEKLKKYLHLPVQSGSDRILKLMNRGYSRNFYLDLVKNYRKIVKGGLLTTDIIVGFPSEKEDDFQDTYDLLKETQFNAAFIFKYSPRPNTQAANFADDVEKKVKERRHSLILEMQKKISKSKSK